MPVMENIASYLLSMPREAWVVAIAIIGLLGILSIIKKAIKLGITVLILAVLVTNGGTYLNKLKNDYSLSVNDTKISAVINGRPIQIDLSEIEDIVVQDTGLKDSEGMSTVTLRLYSVDGAETMVEVPSVIYKIIDGIVQDK